MPCNNSSSENGLEILRSCIGPFRRPLSKPRPPPIRTDCLAPICHPFQNFELNFLPAELDDDAILQKPKAASFAPKKKGSVFGPVFRENAQELQVWV